VSGSWDSANGAEGQDLGAQGQMLRTNLHITRTNAAGRPDAGRSLFRQGEMKKEVAAALAGNVTTIPPNAPNFEYAPSHG
jgi:hypothetical protein